MTSRDAPFCAFVNSPNHIACSRSWSRDNGQWVQVISSDSRGGYSSSLKKEAAATLAGVHDSTPSQRTDNLLQIVNVLATDDVVEAGP